MPRGRVIAIDGIDGCGKTTLCKYVQSRLTEQFGETIVLPALGAGIIGKAVRNHLLHSKVEISHHGAALWVASAQYETIFYEAEPLLADGKNVVLDRYISSYFSYQCFGGDNLSAQSVYHSILWPALQKVPLDLYLYASVDQQTADSRLIQRGNLDNLDQWSIYRKMRVLEGYETFYDEYPYVKSKIDCRYSEKITRNEVDQALRRVFTL